MAPAKSIGLEGNEIKVSGIDIEWNLKRGTCTFERMPVALMWVDTTLAGLMSGVQAMVGTERFLLALQSEGRKSVEADWGAIAQFPDFREGFKAIAKIAAVAGWGEWLLLSLDEEKKECCFRVTESWEGRYQRALGVCWGSGMLAGKMAGYCSKLFGTNCWADQTAFIARGDPFDEFVVRPSSRSVETEIKNLLVSDEATRADMAVALQNLEKEINERKQAEEALAQEAIRRRILVEQSRDGIVVLDQTGKVYEANQIYAEMLGYSAEELSQLYVWDWDAQWTQEELLEQVRRVDAKGDHFETRHRRKDGTIFDVEISTNGAVLGGQKLIFCVCRDISQRKAAERALRESEKKYRLLVSQVPAVVFKGYRDWSVDFFDNKVETLTGYRKDDFDSRRIKWSDLILPEDLDYAKEVVVEALKSDGAFVREHRIRTNNGEIRWVQCRGQIIFDPQGKIDHINGVTFDITPRKQVEEALLKYKFIANSAKDYMTLIDRNYIYEAANAAYCQAHGKAWEEVVGTSVANVWGKDTFEKIIKVYLDRCFAGHSVEFEGWFDFGKLGRGCYHVFYSPYFNADGTVAYASVVSHDITESKKADQAFQALMKSTLGITGQEYFDVLVNSLAKWLDCEVALVGEIIEGNVVKILSLQVDGNLFHDRSYHLEGTPCENVEHKDFCLYSHGVQGRFPQAQTLLDLQAEGYVGIPIRDSHNRVIGALSAISRKKLIPPPRTKEVMHLMAVKTAAEIQRRRMEQERENIEKQLRQAQKMEAIGTLAGGIAHDFNNILGAIIGFAELTLQSVPRGSQEHYNLIQVLNAGERAKDLVKQILVFSRQAGQEKRPLQVSSVIKETLKLLRASLPTTIEIKENLGSHPAMVLADSTQFHQILMNLGANAAHAMREHGGVLEVNLQEVSLDRSDLVQHPELTPGPYVVLTVRDTGCGIDQEIIGRIFEPFYTTKEVGEGTGMGLAVVHGIIKSCGGEITVSSRLGEGTTFTILLPKITGEVAPSAAVPAPLPTGTESILFIDDEEMLVNLTREMLKKLGYQVVVQSSGLEALKIFQAQPEKFDLVITDQTMPHMTGLQLAQEFRHLRPDIPIILCTGYSEKVSLENIKAAGINDLLMKPFVMRNLAETIRKVLD